MNKFELRGQVVSYGTTKNCDWIEISTYEGSITVYLEGISLNELESKLDDAYVEVAGYLQSYKYMDYVAVVATELDIL